MTSISPWLSSHTLADPISTKLNVVSSGIQRVSMHKMVSRRHKRLTKTPFVPRELTAKRQVRDCVALLPQDLDVLETL